MGEKTQLSRQTPPPVSKAKCVTVHSSNAPEKIAKETYVEYTVLDSLESPGVKIELHFQDLDRLSQCETLSVLSPSR